MMDTSFKSVVMVGDYFPFFKRLVEAFKDHPQVMFFRTHDIDEISQISRQGNETFIFTYNKSLIMDLYNYDYFDPKKGGVNIFYYELTPALQNASNKDYFEGRKITVINGIDYKSIYKLLCGAVMNLIPAADKDLARSSRPKDYYVTQFRRSPSGIYDVAVSSHEEMDEIETLFMRSWTLYCSSLCQQLPKTPVVDSKFSEFYCNIVYPHHEKSFSVVSLRKGITELEDNIQRALDVLKNTT